MPLWMVARLALRCALPILPWRSAHAGSCQLTERSNRLGSQMTDIWVIFDGTDVASLLRSVLHCADGATTPCLLVLLTHRHAIQALSL